MTISEFIKKWSAVRLTERSAAQQHFLELCELFQHPRPADVDLTGEWYTFEIAEAAAELDRLRNNWLNPSEWVREEVLEIPGSVEGPWARYVHEANDKGIGSVRCPRQVPRDEESARKLAKRTLTNLYNERPTWLDMAHRRLDETVFAAYGWQADMSNEAILVGLLKLNQERE